MGLVFTFVLIVLAWLLSGIIDAIPHLWHVFSIAPFWLIGIIVIGAVSWFISEP